MRIEEKLELIRIVLNKLIEENTTLKAEREAILSHTDACAVCKHTPSAVWCREVDCECSKCPRDCKCKECIGGEGYKGFEWSGKESKE